MNDILDSLRPVIHTLDRLAIPFSVGGSIVSSAYGIPRSTLDVDIVILIHSRQADEIVSSLESEFYIEKNQILEGIQRRSSFNIIHLQSMLKIDLFILKERPFDQQAFSRRKEEWIGDEEQKLRLYFYTPEDIILHKLEWFRLGGEISNRQWGDIIGVLQVQDKNLDFTHLQNWARELRVADLLEKALKDSGISIT